MVVLVGPSRIHLAISYHETIATLCVEGPVRRVLEEQVLHQHGLRALDVQQARSVLLMLQEVNGTPPLLSVTFGTIEGSQNYNFYSKINVPQGNGDNNKENFQTH